VLTWIMNIRGKLNKKGGGTPTTLSGDGERESRFLRRLEISVILRIVTRRHSTDSRGGAVSSLRLVSTSCRITEYVKYDRNSARTTERVSKFTGGPQASRKANGMPSAGAPSKNTHAFLQEGGNQKK